MTKRFRCATFVAVLVLILTACQPAAVDTSQAIKFSLGSTAFQDSGLIPQKFTCDGGNVSPELNWSGAPIDTKSYALIMDDPDAPGGTFTHWVQFDIPAAYQQLAEGAGANHSIGVGGNNGLGQTGYLGPCPPSGIHRYYFRLYALNVPSLNLKAGAARSDVEKALSKHVIGAADAMGRYEKQ